MISIIKKEIVFYLVILFLLAIAKHSDLLSSPVIRFADMQSLGNYFHPFLWSAGVYLVILILRIIVKFVKKIFNRGEKK